MFMYGLSVGPSTKATHNAIEMMLVRNRMTIKYLDVDVSCRNTDRRARVSAFQGSPGTESESFLKEICMVKG